MKRLTALLAVPFVAASLTTGGASAGAAAVDGTCVASIVLNFSPPATEPLPPSAGPATTATGAGTISTCVFPGGGAMTGTFSYTLTGNLTCTAAQNVAGTLDIAWSDGIQTAATVTSLVPTLGAAGGAAGLSAAITSGRFDGDQITIANLRDPLALITCLTTGLATATGTTSLTFTQPGLSTRRGGPRRVRRAAGEKRARSGHRRVIRAIPRRAAPKTRPPARRMLVMHGQDREELALRSRPYRAARRTFFHTSSVT